MFMEFIKSDIFNISVAGVTALLLIMFIVNSLKLRKINKNYNLFMKKLGNGNNVDEMLKDYINKVQQVENKNTEIMKYCERLDNEIATCIQKVGMVRYSAFKDTGSDLSFALALLDENNDRNSFKWNIFKRNV